MQIIEGADGKLCTAKTAYVITLCVVLIKVVIGGVVVGGVESQAPDLQGMAALLGVVGATYFGRARTKEKNRHVD